ncbi:unnamed protein product [Rhizophagus irregularis]|uniref:Uncharacterized protein n=1 Tax=Rhizophagus irregularis TaxID=588596 RepID=A0A915Z0F8_9GLOM|nr:unnamed protein product [Rhizophagus irregularis]CAB5355953.1 unnamed protein product [Rhizophagus irregularis]
MNLGYYKFTNNKLGLKINFHNYGDFENIEIIGRGVLKAGWVNRDMCIAIKGIKLFPMLMKKFYKRSDHHKNIIRFYEISKGNYYLKGLNYSLTMKIDNTSSKIDPTLGKYLMILKYANQGTLRNYLQTQIE